MGEYVITLTENQEKALLHVCASVQDWVDNAVHNRARQAIDECCEKALSDNAHVVLTAEQKAEVAQDMTDAGVFFESGKKLPESIKEKIISYADIKTAKEIEAEMLADMENK